MLLNRENGHLHYDLVGPPTAPVVCMTHSLTSDGGMWAEQVPALLEAGYQVLRLDMRGHGGSSPYPGHYTIEILAADVIAILDHFDIIRAGYCNHGEGRASRLPAFCAAACMVMGHVAFDLQPHRVCRAEAGEGAAGKIAAARLHAVVDGWM